MMAMLGRVFLIFFKLRNNPDYAGAVFTAYGLILAQALLQILLVPLYLDVLGEHRFGILMMLLSYTAAAFLFLSWLYAPLLRLFGRAIEDESLEDFSRRHVAGRLACVAIGLPLSIIVLVIEIWQPVLFGGSEAGRDTLWALAFANLHFMFLCDIAVSQGALAASGKQTQANLNILAGLGAFVISVVPWLLMGGGLVAIFICFLFGDIVSRLLATLSLRRIGLRIARSPFAVLPTLRQIFTGAQHYFLYTVFATALQADVLLVGALGGGASAAEYALVWKIAELLILVLTRLAQHLQPEFVVMAYRDEQERMRRVYREAYIWIAVAAALLAVLYASTGRWIVSAWVGEANVPSSEWAFVLAGAAIFFIGLTRLPVALVLASGAVKPLWRLSAAEVAAKLLLIVLLFPSFGLLAPLMAIVLVHVGGAAYGYARLHRSCWTSPNAMANNAG